MKKRDRSTGMAIVFFAIMTFIGAVSAQAQVNLLAPIHTPDTNPLLSTTGPNTVGKGHLQLSGMASWYGLSWDREEYVNIPWDLYSSPTVNVHDTYRELGGGLTLRYGFGSNDEPFYQTIPHRLLMGDALFKDEWHLSLMSSFLLLPFTAVYTFFAGSTDGIVLAARIFYIVIHCAATVLLYSRQDIMAARWMMDRSEPNPDLSEEEQRAVRRGDLDRLNRMIRYCETQNCLRAELLSYFGQKAGRNCGFCANCTGHRYSDAQNALAAEARPRPTRTRRRHPEDQLIRWTRRAGWPWWIRKSNRSEVTAMEEAKNCRNCGAPLNEHGDCEYCGTKQTVPKLDDEKTEEALNRIKAWSKG